MDTDIMTQEEMMASEYYQGFMRPHGCFWHTGLKGHGNAGRKR
jgi:hypothetical protein